MPGSLLAERSDMTDSPDQNAVRTGVMSSSSAVTLRVYMGRGDVNAGLVRPEA